MATARTLSPQAYVDKVFNPRTPEDLILALQNSASPAYKELMNLLLQQLQIYLILEALCQHYLVESYKASQAEKAALLKQITVKEVEQPKAKEPIKPSVTVSDMSAPQLKEQLDKLVDDILELDSQRDNIARDIEKAKEQYEKEWTDFTEEQIKERTDKMEEQNIQFVGLNGKSIHVNSINGQEIMKIALNAPSPGKVKRIEEESYQQAVAAKIIPASSHRPSQEVRAHWHNVLIGIRALGALKALEQNTANKEQLRTLLQVNEPALTALGQGKSVLPMINKGDISNDYIKKQEQELTKIDIKKEQKKLNYQVTSEQYKKVSGVAYQPKISFAEKIEEKSKLTPRPPGVDTRRGG